jgi:hypothetical protein
VLTRRSSNSEHKMILTFFVNKIWQWAIILILRIRFFYSRSLKVQAFLRFLLYLIGQSIFYRFYSYSEKFYYYRKFSLKCYNLRPNHYLLCKTINYFQFFEKNCRKYMQNCFKSANYPFLLFHSRIWELQMVQISEL